MPQQGIELQGLVEAAGLGIGTEHQHHLREQLPARVRHVDPPRESAEQVTPQAGTHRRSSDSGTSTPTSASTRMTRAASSTTKVSGGVAGPKEISTRANNTGRASRSAAEGGRCSCRMAKCALTSPSEKPYSRSNSSSSRSEKSALNMAATRSSNELFPVPLCPSRTLQTGSNVRRVPGFTFRNLLSWSHWSLIMD
ncbi:hypothetical protein ACN28S_03245 [Cystobacter fuscus]